MHLHCFNCNRSCEQAPTAEHMRSSQIERFVAESIAGGVRWERIRTELRRSTMRPSTV